MHFPKKDIVFSSASRWLLLLLYYDLQKLFDIGMLTVAKHRQTVGWMLYIGWKINGVANLTEQGGDFV